MKIIDIYTKGRHIILSLATIACCSHAKAQQVTIPIETEQTAVVLQTDTAGHLNTIYIGKKLENTAEYGLVTSEYKQTVDYTGMYKSAYTPAGSRNLLEPAIAVTHADGNNSLDLQYVSYNKTKISNDISLLTVLLKDPVYNFQVTLYYKSYYKENVLEQWSAIQHHEKGNIVLQKFASANLNLSAGSYWLRQYHGNWAREMQPEETMLTHGIKTLDSKLGTRANLFYAFGIYGFAQRAGDRGSWQCIVWRLGMERELQNGFRN